MFGKRRAYQKKVAISPCDGIFSAHGMVLRPKEDVICKDFLPFFISSDTFLNEAIRISVGGLSPTINWKDIKELEFELPSIEDQKIISDKLWAAYELKRSYQDMIKATDEMVKSQFIEMFSGNKTEYVLLSSICSIFIDGDWIESKDQSESGIRLIQTGNIGCGYYKDKGDKAKYISEQTFNKLHCTEVYPGDILISRLPDPVGRACIIPEGLGKCITAVDCTIIRLSDKMLPEFFVTYTNTPEYLTQIKSTLAGSTRLRVSRGNLGKVHFPLPSIEQQQAFVSIVNQADKSKFMRSKSQFIEMFGSIDNNKHRYPVCRISEVCDILNGYAFQSKKYVDTGIRVIRIANVQKGYIVHDTFHLNTKALSQFSWMNSDSSR